MTAEEIMRESALQEAVKCKWEGWSWKKYQRSIISQNYLISAQQTKLECACNVNGRAAVILEHLKAKNYKAASAELSELLKLTKP